LKLSAKLRKLRLLASGNSIRVLPLLNKKYGKGRWRKKKGIAAVKLKNETFRIAEIHWYEAHGIGKKDLKIKFPFLD